jgi:TetR/AcrR family transcriptional regulator, regulator of biofilm formation and stress response
VALRAVTDPGQQDVSTDGRLARGARRRAEIIEATLQVVEQHGTAGVTHRAVANAIGVSPSALTHHFPTIDDLLTAALTSGILWSDTEFETATTVDELARMVSGQLSSDPARLIAVYELYLLASRREALRPAARAWVTSLRRIARRFGADAVGETALVTAIDGLGLLALLSEEGVQKSEVRAVLRRAVGDSS